MPGFQDIIGHEMVKEHFIKAIEARKVSHAYILTGEDGMGKRALADAFALTLLCEKGGTEPCMECHSCKQVLSGNHPDLIYVTHEKPATISVDDIREQIVGPVVIRPYNGFSKIFIVDEAEKMNVQAQNALLKTIEEPPAYAVILLLTTNEEAFLPTILSRCVRLKLKPLKDEAVKQYLLENVNVTETEADIFTAFARGNLGKALQLAQSEEFREVHDQTLSLVKHIKEMNISMLLDCIKELKENHLDIYQCLDLLQLWYRDVLIFKTTKDINLLIFKDEYGAINEISQKSGYDGLEKILKAIDKARVRLDANVNIELALELMFLAIKEN